jgi:hypothetical protein
MSDDGHYVGVEAPGGYGSYGYLYFDDGSVFPANSGNAHSLDTPEGKYEVGQKLYDPLNGKGHEKRHLHPMGTSDEEAPIPDKRAKGGKRTEIETHYSHGSYTRGSLGCIAYQDNAAAAHWAGASTVTVDESGQSIEQVQQQIEKQLGKQIDWTKVKAPVPQAGTGLGSDRSKTKKGNQIKAQDHGVRVGPKQRKVAHRQASLESGGQVIAGAQSIKVGRQQQDVAAVTHDTTDGSPIATGEDSVHMIT